MEPVFSIPIDLSRPVGGVGHALQTQLREAILGGRLPPGQRLPSTRKAAEALGIGRNTVIAVYERLLAEGYLSARPGACPEVNQLRHATRQRARPAPTTAASRLPERWRQLPVSAPTAVLNSGSFRTGMPDAGGFPHLRWRQLMQRSLRNWARQPFAYPSSQGLPELRNAIASHVAFARAVACHGDDVIVTSGATQAFDLLARVFVEPGRSRVAIEWPGYPPMAQAFAAAGARLLPVAVDDAGLCVEQIAAQVEVICVTPSHQSPTGVFLSQARRGALLDHADRCNAIVIEDDYDGEFRYGQRPLDALQTLDRAGRVFYVGTFSKSMFPSLRIGYIIAPGWAREALVAAKRLADPHGNDIVQSALASFIAEGDLARHVRRMQREYANRRSRILAALEGPLRHWLQPLPSEAGLHLAARLRDAADPPHLISAAHRHLPGITTLAAYAQADDIEAGLLFGFGCIDATQVEAHLRRFARALTRG